MLLDFLKANRAELIARCNGKAAERALPGAKPPQSETGIPQFVDQLIETFRAEQTPEALARHAALGPRRPSLALVPSDIASTAAKHGNEMRHHGLTIDQVVHGYGDLCQALTELAMELDEPISVDEFHTFNRCLDDAIADAVTAFSRDAEIPVSTLAQMRDLVDTAVLSFATIKAGEVALKGATSALHDRTLLALQNLLDGALGSNAGTPGFKDAR